MTASAPPPDGTYDRRATMRRETWQGGRLVAVVRFSSRTPAAKLVQKIAKLKPFGHFPDAPK